MKIELYLFYKEKLTLTEVKFLIQTKAKKKRI